MQVFAFIMFVCALFGMVMPLQVNIDSDTKALDIVQKANEFAVHDAAIALKFSDYSQGDFLFDKEEGMQNYINSVNYSLNVSWDGTKFVPNEDSFFQKPINLVYIDFVDLSHPSCSVFPCNFNIPITNTVEILAGPAVVAILETKSPRFFVGEPSPIRRLSIYKYK